MNTTLTNAVVRVAAAAGVALLAAGAVAQTSPPSTTSPGGTMTDTAPPAAEERDSTGAVVLEKSMVPAQRDKAREAAAEEGARTRDSRAVGRDATRIMGNRKNQAEQDALRREREEQLRRQGAGSLPAN